MSIDYAIIVKNKTRLETLIDRFNTQAQAKFYIEGLGGDFEDYLLEHQTFHAALADVQIKLSKIIKHKIVERKYVPAYLFSEKNVIVAIGQDGLVANTAKYANAIPIIGINPDKKRYDGILLPFDVDNFLIGVQQVMERRHTVKTIRFAEAVLNDGQRLIAFNDFFIGASSHISARYKISFNKNTEEHSSSGIIVSTKAGSTGWMSSVFNMAYGITALFEKNLIPKTPLLKDDDLLFAVREPFQSIRTQIKIAAGKIKTGNSLTIESLMPIGGIIFSDGIESDFLKFNSGSIATIRLANESASLVVSSV